MEEKRLNKEELREYGRFFKQKAEEMAAVLEKYRKNPKACDKETLRRIAPSLEEASKKYDEFAPKVEGVTAHKIGSPLLKIGTGMMIRFPPQKESQPAPVDYDVFDPEYYVPMMLADIDRLKLSADTLLNPEKFRPIKLEELVKKFEKRQTGVKLSIGDVPKARTAGIDVDKILDVMDEVVVNAKRHGKADKIHLDAKLGEHHVDISIWNNGKTLPEKKGFIGVSIHNKEALNRLFGKMKKSVGGYGVKYSEHVLSENRGSFTLENKRKEDYNVRARLLLPLKK